MVPNWSIIKEIDAEDSENFMVSINYMQEATDRGWYDPESGKPFIWQETYAPQESIEFATGRFWLFHQTFAPGFRNWPDRHLNGDPYKAINQYMQTDPDTQLIACGSSNTILPTYLVWDREVLEESRHAVREI